MLLCTLSMRESPQDTSVGRERAYYSQAASTRVGTGKENRFYLFAKTEESQQVPDKERSYHR